MTAPAAIASETPITLAIPTNATPSVPAVRPRTAGDHADDRADRRRRHEEHARIEQPDAVVDDGRDGAGHIPGADQGADRQQDEDRAHGGAHPADRRLGQRRRRVAVLERDQARERSAEHQRDLQRPIGRADPEGRDRERDQQDQDDDRQDRVEHARRPRLPSFGGPPLSVAGGRLACSPGCHVATDLFIAAVAAPLR